jgi:hypothetical protein
MDNMNSNIQFSLFQKYIQNNKPCLKSIKTFIIIEVISIEVIKLIVSFIIIDDLINKKYFMHYTQLTAPELFSGKLN